MHVHTTESDGDRTAEEQIRAASQLGLPHVWITDHDMIRDLPRIRELQSTGQKHSVTVGFGVEITVLWQKKEHHLLGYFPNAVWTGAQLSPQMLALQAACAEVKASRENRNLGLVQHLNSVLSDKAKGRVYFTSAEKASSFKGMTVRDVALWSQEHAGLLEPTSLGRPHFLKYLVEVCGVKKDVVFGPRTGVGKGVMDGEGVVHWDEDGVRVSGESVEALMHTAILGAKNITFEPLPIVDAMDLIREAGGYPVVAHIPTLGPDWWDSHASTMPEMRRLGMWGIETYSSEISEEDNKKIDNIAWGFKMTRTGGSDNHGSLKGYARLGDVHRAGTEEYKALEKWREAGLETSSKMLAGEFPQKQKVDLT